jgi:hypothetical protein
VLIQELLINRISSFGSRYWEKRIWDITYLALDPSRLMRGTHRHTHSREEKYNNLAIHSSKKKTICPTKPHQSPCEPRIHHNNPTLIS